MRINTSGRIVVFLISVLVVLSNQSRGLVVRASDQSEKSPIVTGRWLWVHPNPNDGTTLMHYFEIKQDGSLISGHAELPLGGTVDFEDGRIIGSEISFRVGSGKSSVVFRGTVDGMKMKLARTEAGRTMQVRFTKLPSNPPIYPNREALPVIRSLPYNGLATTPPMGWNAWNHFHDFINDQMVREVVQAMVSSGMRDAGYIYVNIDDEWSGERDDRGIIHSNRNFPDMKGLADFVHSKGMKIGLYSSPGPQTCEGHVGSMNHEGDDARTFAGWGIDYLKYDWCSASFVYSDKDMRAVYQKMGAALQKTGRPIVFSLCQYGRANVSTWGSRVGGNLWRTTPDVQDNWSSVLGIWESQHAIASASGRGGWNDPDMLEVGNGGMSQQEYRTHFTLWAFLSAPLIAGNDPRSMSPSTREILTNEEVISIDQDPLAAEPLRIAQSGEVETWMKPLSGGGFALLFLNTGNHERLVKADWNTREMESPIEARDLWSHKDFTIPGLFEAVLPSHGVKLLRLPESAKPPMSILADEK